MERIHRYTMKFQVPYYECDVNDKMRLSFVLKHVQQIGTEQLDRMGLTYEKLWEEKQCFVLAKLGMKIYRMPVSDEEITVYSSPQGTRGAQFLREVTFASDSGEKLIEVQTIWLLMDPESRKIVRPQEFRHTLPAVPPQEQMTGDYGNQRIKVSGPVIWQGEHLVMYSDIDINHHMNNTVYADIITDALPYEVMTGQEMETFFIQYHREAVLGDCVHITSREGEDSCYYVVGEKEAGCCFESKISFYPPKKEELDLAAEY